MRKTIGKFHITINRPAFGHWFRFRKSNIGWMFLIEIEFIGFRLKLASKL